MKCDWYSNESILRRRISYKSRGKVCTGTPVIRVRRHPEAHS